MRAGLNGKDTCVVTPQYVNESWQLLALLGKTQHETLECCPDQNMVSVQTIKIWIDHAKEEHELRQS